MEGAVTEDGQPRIWVPVGRRDWSALIDTGFNGYLELPSDLNEAVNAKYSGKVLSRLANGDVIAEDSYEVEFPFDGEIVAADATFANVSEILIGTRLLRNHRLEINFARRTVVVERDL